MVGLKSFLTIGFLLVFGFSSLDSMAQTALSAYQLYENPSKTIELDFELREISGLCLTNSGKLFGHHDELGEIFQIDLHTGKILKSFFASYLGLFGREAVKADFEGIAYAHRRFYLITSDGFLYEFLEGKDNAYVPYKKYDTGLSLAFNIEGLCFDPKTNALLLACKEAPGKFSKTERFIFSFSLESHQLSDEPRFRIPLKELLQVTHSKKFNPSGIEFCSSSETFFIIASQGKLLIEVSAQGELLDLHELDKKTHSQPEGITFGPNGSLIIANEGKKHGWLIEYKRRKTARQ